MIPEVINGGCCPAKWLSAFIGKSRQDNKSKAELLRMLQATATDTATANKIKEYLKENKRL
jgi:hypothetical protein